VEGKPSPLSGLKVVELARILAGPWAGQVLADLGADVTKVESPAGDDTRTWGPPFIDNPDGTRDAAYFHAANRGKRSVVADFTTPEGQAAVRALIADADVVIRRSPRSIRGSSIARSPASDRTAPTHHARAMTSSSRA